MPHAHGAAVAVAAALTAGGPVAPLAVDGPMTGPVFPADVGRILLPELRPGMAGVMGHLPRHNVAGVREAVDAAGGRPEDLPPCRPDGNPIENAVGKFRRRRRTAAAPAIGGVYAAMRDAVKRLEPGQCLNDLRHDGYGPATPA